MSSINSGHIHQSSRLHREEMLPNERYRPRSSANDSRKRKSRRDNDDKKDRKKRSTASKSDSVNYHFDVTSKGSSTQEAHSMNNGLTSTDSRQQMEDSQRVKQWQENIRRQVKVCSQNCLREIVDRVCCSKDPLNNQAIQAIIDYIKLPSKIADSVYQIALGICMLDYDHINHDLDKNYRFSYFGCDFCVHCFNVLFMKSQPQDYKRCRRIEYSP